MADLKISALTSATTPLAGTEVLPLVQSSTTKKVAVSDLTAGRTVTLGQGIISRNMSSGNWLVLDDSRTGYGDWSLYKAGSNDLTFGYDTTGGSAPVSAITFEYGGDVKIQTGNLVVGTSGKGIDFAVTSGAGTSELLNDYEEGTWTPTNTNAVTVNSAKYTKIGRIVICTFDITAGGSATTGDMGGLPFNATNPTSGGVLSYHNENGTETWSVSIEASGAAAWSFRLGSTQKQLSAGKNAKGMITYSL